MATPDLPWLAAHAPPADAARPWITLTFAQSRDGKIAGAGRTPLRLSGDASMHMTHRLRAMHAAILVGVGTILADDPRLNVRIEGYTGASPRPVVLDSTLRTPPTCKVLQRGARPLVLAAAPRAGDDAWGARRAALERAGAVVELVDADEHGLAWRGIRAALHAHGLGSVMVEGGAGVIDSALQAHAREPTVDVVIVTVAPVDVGEQGYGYTARLRDAPAWVRAETHELAPDTVEVYQPCR